MINHRAKNILLRVEQQLQKVSSQMQDNLRNILIGNTVDLIEGYAFKDVQTLYFEYDYDSLGIYFWAEDKDEIVVTNRVIRLPFHEKSSVFSNELLDDIMDLEDALFEIDKLQEEQIEDVLDEFNQDRCAVLEKWFLSSWVEVRKHAPLSKACYFSIHDSYHKTKLN